MVLSFGSATQVERWHHLRHPWASVTCLYIVSKQSTAAYILITHLYPYKQLFRPTLLYKMVVQGGSNQKIISKTSCIGFMNRSATSNRPITALMPLEPAAESKIHGWGLVFKPLGLILSWVQITIWPQRQDSKHWCRWGLSHSFLNVSQTAPPFWTILGCFLPHVFWMTK